MPLMLLGDESELMVGRYLDRGDMWVGFAYEAPVAVCVVTDEGHGVTEVKNLAVCPDFQCRGIGRRMLAHVESLNAGRIVTLGTGETPSTLRFYKSCGYRYSHRVPDFSQIISGAHNRRGRGAERYGVPVEALCGINTLQ